MITFETVKKACEQARNYASGDNKQPFRFRFNQQEARLSVDYLGSKAKHTLAYDDYTYVITLAYVCQYWRHALSSLAPVASVELGQVPSNFSVDVDNVLHLKLVDAEGERSPLSEALTQRLTYRKPFKTMTSAPSILTDLSFSSQLDLRVITERDPKLIKFVSRCDSLVWADKQLGLDIMGSVDFDHSPPKEGLPPENLGVPMRDTKPIRWIQNHTWLHGLFSSLQFGKVMEKTQAKLWDAGGGALLFTVTKDADFQAQFEACCEMVDVILLLAGQGYQTQPSTLTSEVLNIAVKPGKNLASQINLDMATWRSQIEEMRDHLQLGNQKVMWLMRFGQAAEAVPQGMRTHRRDVNDILREE